MDPIRAHWIAPLLPHPTVPAAPLSVSIEATVTCFVTGVIECRYDLSGTLDQCVMPSHSRTQRADELWRHTCFEAFVGRPGELGYHEFNWSPSGAYAAYAFSDYRVRAEDIDAGVPLITSEVSESQATVIVRLRSGTWPAGPLELGLSAVIEAVGGGLHYFAVHHPLKRPDFHDRRGFLLRIA